MSELFYVQGLILLSAFCSYACVYLLYTPKPSVLILFQPNLVYLIIYICLRNSVTRDRMGRLFSFVARVMQDVAVPAVSMFHGLGVDEHTALLLDITTGDASAVGVGTAYVCEANHKAQICKSGTSLTYQGSVRDSLSADFMRS